MSQALRVIYAGTPEFAVPALQALLDSRHAVVAVYTQPDRPAGRGRKLRPSPVKALAQAHDLPVEQPVRLKGSETLERLAGYAPDVMVVAAYGLILPQRVLALPAHGCLNIHASLLPRWRGAAPIQRALLAGDTETGVTIMQMAPGLDTGAMLLKRACSIRDTETAASLHERLATLGAEALLATLEQLVAGELQPEPQDEAAACYAAKLDKAEAALDWREPAVVLARQVRGFNPWPIAYTYYQGQPLRIWAATPLAADAEAAARQPGEIVAATAAGIDVATGQGILRITELQLPGGKPLAAGQFLNARSLAGVRFTSE